MKGHGPFSISASRVSPHALAVAKASGERSTPITACPSAAKCFIWRPCPQPMSNTVPACGTRCPQRLTQAEASVKNKPKPGSPALPRSQAACTAKTRPGERLRRQPKVPIYRLASSQFSYLSQAKRLSGCRRSLWRRAGNGRFFHGHVDQPRKNTQHNRDVPHHVITPRFVVQHTTQPHPHE